MGSWLTLGLGGVGKTAINVNGTLDAGVHVMLDVTWAGRVHNC